MVFLVLILLTVLGLILLGWRITFLEQQLRYLRQRCPRTVKENQYLHRQQVEQLWLLLIASYLLFVALALSSLVAVFAVSRWDQYAALGFLVGFSLVFLRKKEVPTPWFLPGLSYLYALAALLGMIQLILEELGYASSEEW